eukprot:Skav233525  [mRNA]  locus=scaffold2975:258320:260080:- [translate_table: standard]
MNAERDCQRIFDNSGLTLPVPIQSRHHECGPTPLTSYYVKPQDWLRHWLQGCPELLAGQSSSPAESFESFWKLYQTEHPTHSIFATHKDHLGQVVPILVHGDEGRSVKKTNYLVVSMEVPFGSHDDPRIAQGCSCQKFLASRPDLPNYGRDQGLVDDKWVNIARKQLTNFKGHSYLSRFLIFGLGGWVYKRHPHVATDLLQEFSTNMRSLFEDGIVLDTGEQFFGALVAIKGDLDFHQKYMNLTRSYSHCGTKNKIEICHLCKGGHEDYPFEEYSEVPNWVSSMFLSRPWNVANAPSLSNIQFDTQRPELAIAQDPFHIVKLGLGRDVVGGVLIYLLRKGFFDFEGGSTNIDARFVRAHSSFSLWCQVEHHSPGLRSFSKAFFNMKNLLSAPWASSKASDTRLLLSWLVWFLRLNLTNPFVPGHSHLLRNMLEVCENTLEINIMHHHGLFLERPCAMRLYVHIMTSLRGYTVLGRAALQYGIRSFIQKPKHHALHHIAYRLREQLLKGSTLIASPQMLACDVNEDFIGHISRLSRRVGFRLCDLRVFQRYFLKIAALLRRRKQKGLNAKHAFTMPRKFRVRMKPKK